MKKVLLLSVVGLLSLSGCAYLTPPVIPALLDGAAMSVTNAGKGGAVDIAVGSVALENTAFRISSVEGLSLKTAPAGAQCYSLNDARDLYCRLGNLSAGRTLQVTYEGKVNWGGFAYLSAPGTTKNVPATIITKP